MTAGTRMERLQEALRVAERVGNTFLAGNIRAAIKEEQRLNHSTASDAPPHRLP